MKTIVYKIVFIASILIQANLGYASSNVTIRGKFSKNINLAKIAFWFNDKMLDPQNPMPKANETKAKVTDRGFEVRFSSLGNSGYMVMGLGENGRGSYIVKSPYYLIYENSDDVYVEIDSSQAGYSLKWSGEGAAKYKLITELNEGPRFESQIANPPYLDMQGELTNQIYACFEKIRKGNDYINSYQAEVSKDVRDILRLDFTNYNLSYLYGGMYDFIKYSSLPIAQKTKFIVEKLSTINHTVKMLETNVAPLSFERSVQLPLAEYKLSQLAATLHVKSPVEIIKEIANTIVRDRVLTFYFLNQEKVVDSSTRESLFNTLNSIIEDEYCLKTLELYYSNSKMGKKVFNFSLPDVNGDIRTLSEFKGKIVFIDFWYTGCGACGEYYRSVVKHVEHKYRDSKDIVFITVSIDQNKEKWQASINSGIYTSNDVLNLHCPDGTKNPIIQQFSVNTYPYPLLIDRDGNIFSNSSNDLRLNGIEGLSSIIEKAIKAK